MTSPFFNGDWLKIEEIILIIFSIKKGRYSREKPKSQEKLVKSFMGDP